MRLADDFPALIDACALYPLITRDVLLSFAEADMYRLHLTERIMDEWTRRLKDDRPDIADKIDRTADDVREHFPSAFVTGYEPMIDGLTLPDPDDRHVLAATITCNAQIVVTRNLRDFPAEALDPHDIAARHPDDFLAEAFDLHQPDGLRVFSAMLANSRIWKDADDMIRGLIAGGLPKLTGRVEPFGGML